VEITLFIQLSLVLALAAGISVVMKLFRQPLIMGYIITGVVAGPSLFNLIHNRTAFESFSQIGIALLLFIVGLGLNISTIRSLGKPVLVVATVNTVLVGGVSYAVALLLGMTPVEALVIAIGMLFSSTIVVIKALSDKKSISRLYGRIAVGVTLMEDILATIALLVITAISGGGATLHDVETLAMRGIALAVGLVVVGAFIMPRLSKFFASSQELLFMFALMWAFGIASLFEVAGFSIEVGALFAGVTLASLPYALEVSNRLKPLRDFFLVLFFVVLGERLSLQGISETIVAALVLAVVVVVFKTFVIAASLGRLSYTEQTSYKVAIHLSQISEFSVILAVLAQSTGLVGQHVTNLMTLTALITIGVSTYLMHYDDKIFRSIAASLKFIERANPQLESRASSAASYKLVLFGYHKGGHEFINAFREMRKRYVVVDYNPEVIEIMERQHINHVFGDATDYELLEEIGVHKAELVVSTITELDTNLLLVRHVNQWNPDGVFICHANSYDHAAQLYEHGAAYVMLPHFIGSEQMSSFIRKNGSNKEAFDRYRKRHILTLGKVAVE
jgi:Kef-type K+ transport system membrane component KefB